MKIYTSYFGNLRALGAASIVPVSVARYTPNWYAGRRYLDVAPTSFMLSGSCSQERYLQLYDDILKKLNPEKVISDLIGIGGGRDVALCCYEKPSDFCHRHLLAKWLNENTSYEVVEWEKEQKAVPQELSLFD